jgi:quercetin dioxygenase-like cupin family protein
MDVSSEGRRRSDGSGTAVELELQHRRFDLCSPDSGRCTLKLSVQCRCRTPTEPGTVRRLRAAASFLVDVAFPAVSADTLVRMVGSFACATGSMCSESTMAVTLRDSQFGQAAALLARPHFEVERTRFGLAHILHEDNVLGLYILELAPGCTIPPHCHRVMRETELVLDDGLLLQGRPVAAGDAFSWALGEVHTYHNPTDVPRRILCIDSPRFQQSDEMPIDPPPPLEPAVPFENYLD